MTLATPDIGRPYNAEKAASGAGGLLGARKEAKPGRMGIKRAGRQGSLPGVPPVFAPVGYASRLRNR